MVEIAPRQPNVFAYMREYTTHPTNESCPQITQRSSNTLRKNFHACHPEEPQATRNLFFPRLRTQKHIPRYARDDRKRRSAAC